MARKKTSAMKKVAKKVNPFVLCLFALIFLGCGIGGFLFAGHVTRNDKFEIVGEKTINLVLGDSPYVDEGAVAISFGKDITNKIVAETNVDYTTEGYYYIRYSVNDIRYKGVYRYRTIIISEVGNE